MFSCARSSRSISSLAPVTKVTTYQRKVMIMGKKGKFFECFYGHAIDIFRKNRMIYAVKTAYKRPVFVFSIFHLVVFPI